METEKIFEGTSIPCENFFKLGRKLGSGGFGDVYEGKWKGNTYAIKVVRSKNYYTPDPDDKMGDPILTNYSDQAMYESLITAYLYSKGCRVVRTHKAFKCSDGKSYIVMDKLLGEDLHSLFTRSGVQYNVKDYITLTYLMLDGLVCCHRNGIIHGDIKPENIFIERTNKLNVVYIDFGLSCYNEGHMPKGFKSFINENIDSKVLRKFRKTRKCDTLTGGGGTIFYMSPEFLRVQGVPTEDISDMNKLILRDSYSLGMTLYIMWAGGNPFADIKELNEYRQTIEDITLKGGPVLSSKYLPFNVPNEIADIITNLIQSNYTERFTVEDALNKFKSSKLYSMLNLLQPRTPSPIKRSSKVLRTPSLPKGLIGLSDEKSPLKILNVFDLPFKDFHEILTQLKNEGVEMDKIRRKKGSDRSLVYGSWRYKDRLVNITLLNSEPSRWEKYSKDVNLIIITYDRIYEAHDGDDRDSVNEIVNIFEKQGKYVCFVKEVGSRGNFVKNLKECISDYSN